MVGPELLHLTQQHAGGCIYVFRYQASIPGPYRLSLKLLRTNFSAVDEVWWCVARPASPFTCQCHQCSMPFRFLLDAWMHESEVEHAAARVVRGAALVIPRRCTIRRATPRCTSMMCSAPRRGSSSGRRWARRL